jgi:hypothetical protein
VHRGHDLAERLEDQGDLKFSVEAAEAIETPAGKFDTLRISAKGFTSNETTGGGARHERVIWLSPAAKREVKHEIRSILKNGNIFRVEGRELVAFKGRGVKLDQPADGRRSGSRTWPGGR